MHSMDETTTNMPTDASFERETTITLSDDEQRAAMSERARERFGSHS